MKITSAYANKLLRQLNDDKSYLESKENTCTYYSAVLGEEPVIPEYNFAEVSQAIEEINRKIVAIKHAINVANVNAQIDVDGVIMTVDEILVRMAQLSRRKIFYDALRKSQPVTRTGSSYYVSRQNQPEYKYINYDLEDAKQAFEKVSEEILRLQMALDIYNQTFEFEVEL